MTDEREHRATPRPIVKPIDSWWTVLVIDPVAVRLVPLLARRRWLNPTRITLTAFVLGLISAALFLEGPLWLAAVLFELRFLLDCLDGKLARHTGTSSVFGAALDNACDLGATTLCLGAFAARTVFEVDGASLLRTVIAFGVVIVFGLAHWAHQFLHTAFPSSGRLGAVPTDGSLRALLAKRRLQAYPTGIELETLLLFVAPWFGTRHAAVFFALGCAFYGLSAIDDARRLLRNARQADEATGSRRPGA
jgi:phosphatidylglycerophosphate synthase